jgi:murein L,D-transpeptidase YcbB/YkuD
MRRAQFGILASSAVALVLAVVATADAAPNAETNRAARDMQRRMPSPTMPARQRMKAPTAMPAAGARARSEQSASRTAAPAAKAVAAAPAVAMSDHPAAEKLRDLLAGKSLERTIPRKNERDAVIGFYQAQRGFAPLWLGTDGGADRVKDVLAYLHGIDADGLEPTDYHTPDMSVTSPEAQAEAELKFTATLLTYARHALNGRVHFSRISKDIDYKDKFDPAEVLKQVAASSNLTRTLDSFNPHQPAYLALKAKFAELRDRAEDDTSAIPHGPALHYAVDRRGKEAVMSDARVPALRERLGLAPQNDTRYDKALALAVAKFQKAQGMKPDGVFAAGTLAALSGPTREQRMGAILATMERWRWMPRDLGKTHVVLNIPDYHLRVYHNGAEVWMTRVVVGKPGKETPLLTETMKYITVNPTWNVPQSIIYNELLPIYETSDPNIFDKMGLKVERNGKDIRVFQPPGERNALGQIRFNFPNKFLVYQHDTPEKRYFSQDKRAYSHGCMRVQDPMKYAEVILSYASPKLGYTAENVRKMLGGDEKQIDFASQIPVHITYQTAFVDEAGKLQFREDIYGLDAKLQAALKGSERAVADVVMERPADPNFQPTAENVQRMRSAASGGNGGGSPFAMFEQLFR